MHVETREQSSQKAGAGSDVWISRPGWAGLWKSNVMPPKSVWAPHRICSAVDGEVEADPLVSALSAVSVAEYCVNT